MARYDWDDLTDRVYNAFGLPNSATQSRPTVAQVKDQLTSGYIQFSRDTKCYKRTATQAVTTATASYAYPTDMFEIRRIRYGTETNDLSQTTEAAMDKISTAWRTDTANPSTYWMNYDARTILLYPIPTFSSGSYNLYIEGYIVPSAVSGGVAIPSTGAGTLALMDEINLAPVWWAVWQLGTHLLSDTVANASQIAQLALQDYNRLKAEQNYRMMR